MKKTIRAAATAIALIAATGAATGAAHAGSPDGKIQVKVMGSAVLADGKVTKVYNGGAILGTTQTEANNNVVPTLAAEYFITPNFSVETICCLTQHDVDATSGTLNGAELVADAKILPATVTLKAHLPTKIGLKPYIGAGPTYFIFIDEKPGADTLPLGVTRQHLNDKFGVVLQAGFDMPINDKGLSLSLDAKRYFLSTTAQWFAGDTEVVATRHKLDPWVLSAGFAYRF